MWDESRRFINITRCASDEKSVDSQKELLKYFQRLGHKRKLLNNSYNHLTIQHVLSPGGWSGHGVDPLGPIFADIFMAHIEENSAMEINDLVLYCQYV